MEFKTATGKRLGENDTQSLPCKKRARIFNDLSFINQRVNITKKLVSAQYFMKINNPGLKNRHTRTELTARFNEYITQLNNSKIEAETMYNFYTGLPNQKVCTQDEIVNEQLDIERVYSLFKTFYNLDWLHWLFINLIY